MLKKLLLPLILLITVQLRGQNEKIKYNDYIDLRNGSRLYCHVINYIPEKEVIYIMEGGSQQTLSTLQVKRVVMSPRDGQKPTRFDVRPYEFRERGLFNATNLTLGFGKDYSANSPQLLTGIQHTVGWQFSRLLGAGLGFSYDNYVVIDGDAPTWAAYGEVRGYFSRRNGSFFYTLAGGYGKLFSTTANEQFMDARHGGLMFQPTIGFRLAANKNYNFVIDFGARFQEVRYEDNNQWSSNLFTINYRRCILRAGIVF